MRGFYRETFHAEVAERRRARRFSPSLRVLRVNRSLSVLGRLVEPEVDGEVEDDVDRFAVQRAGLEFPLLHGVDGCLIEAERQRLENLMLSSRDRRAR